MQRTALTPSSPPLPTTETLIQPDDYSSDSPIWIVFWKMLFFIILMAVAPLASFFIAKDYIFEGIFHVSTGSSYTYSAIVAVIVVHIVLIAFLFVAFREEIPMKKKSIETNKDSSGKTD